MCKEGEKVGMQEKTQVQEIVSEVGTEVTDRTKSFVKKCVKAFFDYLESRIDEFPELIEKIREDSKIKKEMEAEFSKSLYAAGLIPRAYAGLPDSLLVHNLQNDGYEDGLYTGYKIALMAMEDSQILYEEKIEIYDYFWRCLAMNRAELREKIKNFDDTSYTGVKMKKQ